MEICGILNRHIRGAFSLCFCLILLSFASRAVFADSATFDLIGPRIELTVTRGGKTLPISAVARFMPGDRLWIHPEFPPDQSVRYLLIVAFLQGPTNPPPESWFTRVETWTKQTRQEGTVVTVPQGAQQALLFLAPETGGDFGTLRGTVRGKPGVFVRASLDLDLASLDRTRLDKYLDEIRKTSTSDPSDLKKRAALLAQTLRIKVNEECFDKPVEEQSACLTQNSDQLVMDDAHSQSVVAEFTSGPSADLIGALGSSPAARGGYYSPYVGAVVDFARLMNNLHSASYRYIPALVLPSKDQLNLRLNSPPSFQNPKSVLVVGLPAVSGAQLPELRRVDPKQVFCLEQSPLVLSVEGAPLVFSTAIAHSFVLHLQSKSGKPFDLPATPDAARGGFVIDTRSLRSASLSPQLVGTLRGSWGFTSFEGPEFQLRSAHPEHWSILSAEAGALIAGGQGTLHLKSDCVPCVEKISLLDATGKDLEPTWKTTKQDELELQLPLKEEHAGQLKLLVKQYGSATPDVLSLRAYSEAAHLDHFTLYAGDHQGVLAGSHLDEVAAFELSGIRFVPGELSHADKSDSLELLEPSASQTTALKPQQNLQGHAILKDGRTLDLQTSVLAPRPRMILVSKSVQSGSLPSAVRLGNSDELPQNDRLSFFLKSDVPASFPRSEKIEIATADDSFDVLLNVADGSLVLQDAKSVLAVFDPLKTFGPSAFGPLRFRPVDADGAKGDWQPLATLVRIPTLKEVRCPDSPDQQCSLSGENLFLLDSVASDPQFKNSISVPAGYVNSTLSVPRPYGTLLYLKLRDDPATVDTATLPVFPDDH